MNGTLWQDEDVIDSTKKILCCVFKEKIISKLVMVDIWGISKEEWRKKDAKK